MSYVTPVVYRTKLMVMNAGGYRFTDFVRLGLPLQIAIRRRRARLIQGEQ